MKEIGLRLREARESKGLTIEVASEQTKIRALYLHALEEGEFEKLPGKVYVKGFIRTYSKLLDIDPTELIQKYQGYLEQVSEEETPVLSEVTVIRNKGSKTFAKIIIFVIILALLAVGFYFVKNTWLTIKNETIPQLLEPEAGQQLASQQPANDLTTDNSVKQLDSINSSPDQQAVTSEDGEMDGNSPLNPKETDNSGEISNEKPSVSSEDLLVDNTVTNESLEDLVTADHYQETQATVDPEINREVEAGDSNSDNTSLAQSNIDSSLVPDTELDHNTANSSQGEELAINENQNKSNSSIANSSQKDSPSSVKTSDMIVKNDEDVFSGEVQVTDDANNQDSSYVRDEERWQNYDPSQSTSTPPVENLAVIEEDQEPKQAVEKSVIQIYASQNSWIRVTADNEVVFQDVIYKGESKLFQGQKIHLRINNAAAITVNYQGILLGPFGKKDELVEKVFGE